MNYLKKLSVASIAAIPKDFKSMAHDTRVPVMRVFGRVEGLERGTSQFGEWTAFIGQFKATALDSAEVYRAGKALFPSIASEAIENAFENGDGNPVEFAIEIGVRRVVKKNAQGDEVGAGYEYTMRPLIEIDESQDPLAALEARALAALPAPADPAQADPEPVKGKAKGK